MESVEEVAQWVPVVTLVRSILTRRELHERLMLRNEQTKQIHLPEVYNESEDAKKNVSTWMNAQLISDAAPQIINASFADGAKKRLMSRSPERG